MQHTRSGPRLSTASQPLSRMGTAVAFGKEAGVGTGLQQDVHVSARPVTNSGMRGMETASGKRCVPTPNPDPILNSLAPPPAKSRTSPTGSASSAPRSPTSAPRCPPWTTRPTGSRRRSTRRPTPARRATRSWTSCGGSRGSWPTSTWRPTGRGPGPVRSRRRCAVSSPRPRRSHAPPPPQTPTRWSTSAGTSRAATPSWRPRGTASSSSASSGRSRRTTPTRPWPPCGTRPSAASPRSTARRRPGT